MEEFISERPAEISESKQLAQRSEHQELPRVGLENRRKTTCYANAAIQVIFRFPELMQAVVKDINNQLIHNQFIIELMSLFDAYVKCENTRIISMCQDRLASQTAKEFPHQVSNVLNSSIQETPTTLKSTSVQFSIC
jgi:ubiquitin C-terminal hydrolase